MEANQVERERWNDERRYSVWPKRERLTSEVTGYVLAAVAPRPGERIVDIGCGGGRSTLAAAEAVGPDGSLVGADISAGLHRLAEERVGEAGARNVRFVLADAQTDAIPGGPFDAAISQFGVMFFDEPVTAFGNIQGHLRPGGRIAFACWQKPEVNPWFFAEAIADLLPSPPPPLAPGKSSAGPFSLADPARTTEILENAGFTDVNHTPHTVVAIAPEDAVFDEAQLGFLGIPDDELPTAMERVERYMERFRIDSEQSRFPLAFQIFTASRP